MKTPVIILHGWAKDMTGQRYETLATILQNSGYTVYMPDLPGFGNNLLVHKKALYFEDYVQFVHDFIIKTVKAKKVI